MAPEENSTPTPNRPESAEVSADPRRNRRPRRGFRGRGRRRKPPGAQTGSPEGVEAEKEAGPQPVGEPSGPPPTGVETDAGPTAFEETSEQTDSDQFDRAEPPPITVSPFKAQEGPPRPASPASIQEAIAEVNGVIHALREALEDMEETMELLEAFERQKDADEREIESLRRAVRQMNRPREGGHSQRGHA